MQIQKYTAALAATVITVVAAHAQQFSLLGHIDGRQDGYAHLYYDDENGRPVNDSTALKNGDFQFTGNIAGPAMVYLTGAAKSMRMDDPDATSFFIDPGTVHFSGKAGDLKNAVITGSRTQDEYAVLNAKKTKIQNRWRVVMDTLSAVNKRSNTEFQELKDWALLPYEAEMKEVDSNFFAGHPQSVVTAFELRFYVSSMPLDSLQMHYDNLGNAVQQSVYGKEIAGEIKKLRAGSPGSVAANFSAKDINGKDISLSDFKGKYVILDFWASWCVPCRASNPHMLALYKQYHDKGLEIIGVSDDDGHEDAWKKAVAKDGVGIWHNVLRGYDRNMRSQGIKNDRDISEKFGIQSLPTKILIDKNGVIIGRYDHGTDEEATEMDNKLAQLMPAKAALNLKGHIRGLKDSVVNISWYDETGQQNENVPVHAESFSWTKALKEPQQVFISISTGYMELFAENADIMIDGSVDSFYESKVTGSAIQNEYKKFRTSISALSSQLYKQQEAVYTTKDEDRKAEIEARIDSISNLIDAEEYKYIIAHPDSRVSLSFVQNSAIMGESNKVNKLYQLLAPELKNSIAGRKLAERIEILKRGAAGMAFKDFTMQALNGKIIHLSDFKGKYVLIDFWASWCGPCRAENPNVLKAYNNYRNKGFTVLGVSLDDNRDKWKKAVDEDKMPWTQISDLKGFNNELASYYGIMAIPATFLIDPNGKIVEKGLRGTKLHRRLAEILNS